MTIEFCDACGEEHDPATRFRCEAMEQGEEPCIDSRGHLWVVSDENENVGYCERCGCAEY